MTEEKTWYHLIHTTREYHSMEVGSFEDLCEILKESFIDDDEVNRYIDSLTEGCKCHVCTTYCLSELLENGDHDAWLDLRDEYIEQEADEIWYQIISGKVGDEIDFMPDSWYGETWYIAKITTEGVDE